MLSWIVFKQVPIVGFLLQTISQLGSQFRQSFRNCIAWLDKVASYNISYWERFILVAVDLRVISYLNVL